MKKTHKILSIIAVIFSLGIILNFNEVKAATATISNDKTVTQGDSVTITANVNAGAWNLQLSGAGQSKGLVGQTSTTSNASASTSITFTASQVGTYKFTLTGDITDYVTDATTQVNKSCTITVKAPSNNNNTGSNTGGSTGGTTTSGGGTTTTKSSNANLKSLWITPKEYDFTGFKASNLNYSVTVPNNVTSITISASKGHSGQTISGTGTKTLKEGTNKFNIVVTAEDGTKKTYTLTAVRKTTETEVPNVIENQTPVTEKVALLLQQLEITGLTLSPEFNSEVYEYTAELTEDLTEVEVIATANQTDAIIEITGNKELKEGENVITVTIKSADGQETKVYTIKLNKKVEEEEEEVSVTPVLSNNDNGDIDKMLKNNLILRIVFIISTMVITGIGIYTLVQEKKYVGDKAKYVSKRMRI